MTKPTTGDWIKIAGIVCAVMLAIVVWYSSVEAVKADVAGVKAFQEREATKIHPTFVTREKLADSLKPIEIQIGAIEKKQDVMAEDVRELLRRIPPG